MALDGLTVAAIVRELNDTILNGRIAKIAQPFEDELLLNIKTSEGLRKLSICAGASMPFVYLTEENKQSPVTAPNFCMLLRKHISNGRIVEISQPSMERIIDFHIEHLNEMGDLCKKILTVELMGKHSNIIFRDDKGMIIDSIKHVSSFVSSVREVLPGREYFIAETSEKLNPFSVTKDEFIEEISKKAMPLSKAIYSTITGFSPVLSDEIVFRSMLDGAKSAKDVDFDDYLHLWNNFSWVMDEVKEGDWAPEIVIDGDGNVVEFSAIELRMYADMKKEKYDSISYVLSDYYSRRAKKVRIHQKSADIRKIVTTLIERNVKKLDIQMKQLKDTEKRDKYRIYGELLQTFGYSAKEGDRSIEVENYYDNTMITIPLDPTKNAMENSQHYFSKYNKLKRTFSAVSVQIEETNAELLHLRSIEVSLDIATNDADLNQIKEELIDAGYIRKKSQKGSKRSDKSKPLHFMSTDGFHIYVGKNNYQNDELTFKFANGSDWWFHAKKMPGSHVIVRSEGKELTDRTFEEAAALAAYYSAGSNMEKVEVDYVIRREVKKPNKAKPGYVVYYTNYSMIAEPKIASCLTEITQ